MFVSKNKQITKEKVAKQNVIHHKNAQRHGQSREHLKSKQAGQSKKSGRIDKCPIHPDGVHTWGNCYQNVINKDKKLPSKGAKSGKMSMHEANLMDMLRRLLTVLPCLKSL
jgi:hypothetical protein